MTSFSIRPGAAFVALALVSAASLATAGDPPSPPSPDARRRAERAAFWTQKLRAPDPLDRYHAEWNLEALAPESAGPVVAALEGGGLNPHATGSACRAAGDIGRPEALPALKKLVLAANQPVTTRLAALIAAAKMLDGPSRELLHEVAKGGDMELRPPALIALGMIEDHTIHDLVESAAGSPDAEVRDAALRAMGWLDDKRFVPTALKGLDDPNLLVRADAARALGKIGDPRAADQIERATAGLRPGALRFWLVDALAHLGRPAAFDELAAHLRDPKSQYREAAAAALADLGDRRAAPIFREVVDRTLRGETPPGADVVSAYALGTLGDKEAVPVLLRTVEKGRIDVRLQALRALGMLKSVEAVPALIAATQDRRLRAAAVLALGATPDARAQEALARAIEDRDPAVRFFAVLAIERAKGPKAVQTLRGRLADDHDFVREAASRAIPALEGRPPPPADPRNPVHLARLRVLEREFLLRAQMVGYFRGLSRLMTDPQYAYVVVGYETYTSSCGGTHPPVEYQQAVYEKVLVKEAEFTPEAKVTELYREKLAESQRLRDLKGDAEGAAGSADRKP